MGRTCSDGGQNELAGWVLEDGRVRAGNQSRRKTEDEGPSEIRWEGSATIVCNSPVDEDRAMSTLGGRCVC